MRTIPELLCPAGDREKFFTALTYGADAVYLGGQDFNLRARTKGFDLTDLDFYLNYARQKKKKVYFCLNVFAYEKYLNQVIHYLERLAEIKPDALIVADPGIIYLAQKYAPHIPLHLSTQANTSNSFSIKFWHKLGIKRVNLARELNYQQIRQVMQKVQKLEPEIELEVFVHGALCMAISGRCFLSQYLTQRSANLGFCSHPCRFEYVLKEKTRDQDVLEVIEIGNYSKILASEDLCLLKYLAWFVKNKLASLKIEGRNKTVSYVATVVDVYKTALSHLQQKKFFYSKYLQVLKDTFFRPAGTGFFLGQPKILYWPKEKRKQTLAWIEKRISSHRWLVKVKSKWQTSLPVELRLPGLRYELLLPENYTVEKENGEKVDVAHPGLDYYLCTECPKLQPYLLIQNS
ncbi:MAG: peptidase U32 family protein [Desulfonauticus sp.]|nr:peptidase U32 family protein [Desulfonauticus sp.]